MPRGYRPVGKNADPEFRTARGRAGAKALHSTDHLIERLVDRAPELTAEQLDKLRTALPPVGGEQS